ncbi:MAG: hypothetical protein AAEB43_07140 [Acidimicrobiales bacterium]|jgi:hypothetical protein
MVNPPPFISTLAHLDGLYLIGGTLPAPTLSPLFDLACLDSWQAPPDWWIVGIVTPVLCHGTTKGLLHLVDRLGKTFTLCSTKDHQKQLYQAVGPLNDLCRKCLGLAPQLLEPGSVE